MGMLLVFVVVGHVGESGVVVWLWAVHASLVGGAAHGCVKYGCPVARMGVGGRE